MTANSVRCLTVWLLAISSPCALAQVAPCDNGAEVLGIERCKNVVYYRPDGERPDPRIVQRLSAGHPDKDVRSIAVIVGISEYPNLNQSLTAVRNDVRKLRSYLEGEGRFDEIVVLENEDATKQNVEYFLGEYLRRRASYFDRRVRVLFAFSGHGFGGEDTNSPALALMNAREEGGTPDEDMISLGALKAKFDEVSKNSFHFLALINACYAGGVFKAVLDGGNENDTLKPGARAITASSEKDLAWSLGGPNDGSVFFDALLDGVQRSRADKWGISIVDETGEKVVSGGIVRLGALFLHMTNRIEELKANPSLPPGIVMALPWKGSIAPEGVRSEGGFFFVANPEVAPRFQQRWLAISAPQSFAIPAKSASSLRGAPDLKVFLDPAAYEIHGIDVSHHNGDIDWKRVAKDGVSFAYMKATEGAARKDERFAANWDNSGAAGIRRGAYHYVSLCKPAEAQFKNFTASVPKVAGMLPPAIDVEPNAPCSPSTSQTVCAATHGSSLSEPWRKNRGFGFSKPGCAVSNIEEARQNLFKLATMLEDHYKMTPVLFGIPESYLLLMDERFGKFNLWLQHKGGDSPTVELPGKAPWTFWQYTVTSKVEGISGKVDRDVFYGSRGEFEAFGSQPGNAALKASLEQ